MDKKLSKPKDIGYKPQLWNFRETKEEIKLDHGENITKEILEKLIKYSTEGYNIQISCGHDHNYDYRDNYSDCDLWIEINIYFTNTERFEAALATYQTRLEKYKKDLAAYEDYMKEEAKRVLSKEEQEAKKKRRAEYLKLKEEFEGK